MSRRSLMVLASLTVWAVAWTLTAEANGSPSSKSAKPTVFTKITRSTQDAWKKTVDVLTPGTKAPKKPKGHSHKSPSLLDKMKSWLPKKKKDMTMDDWLLLPRPGM